MYIIELFIKLNEDIKSGIFRERIKKIFKKEQNIPRNDETEQCDHLFVPIDSTGRVLACSKCGKVIKRKNPKTNPFKKD